MDAAVWGFVGVVVGGLITVGAEIIRARNLASIDSAKRRDDRAIDRDRFQLAKLEELLQAIDALGRVTTRISLARRDASATAGRWLTPDEYLDDELKEANREATLRTSSLASVVLDDEVRSLCKIASQSAVYVAAADTPEAAAAAYVEHITAVADASTRSGAVIRDLLSSSTSR